MTFSIPSFCLTLALLAGIALDATAAELVVIVSARSPAPPAPTTTTS